MSERAFDPAEKLARIRLARTQAVGPVTFHDLVGRYGSARAALGALPELAQRGGRRAPLRIAAIADAERELDAHARLGAQLVACGEPGYPAALAALEDAPPLVTVRGDLGLLARHCVAIARDLGAAGWCVVSGLARGIDGAAHQGALDSGTIGVVGGGADVVYPREHEALQTAVATRGAVVAESPLGTEPRPHHFPRRNRVISGLSLGVVVVEAALKSGSLITARFAADQGREVFAVPGSPLDPRCRGSNGLIRDGAHLVEGAADVIGVLETLHAGSPSPTPRAVPSAAPEHLDPGGEIDLDQARAAVLEMLDPHPVPVDELVRRCQLSPAALMTALLELELAGRVLRHSGNRVARVMDA